MKTVLRYAGGKSRAIKKITPFVEPYDTIVSPFIGGGSLEVYWASEGKKVVGADTFGMLVNFWHQLLDNNKALASELEKIQPTQEVYKLVKELLVCSPETQDMLAHWKTDFYKRQQVLLPEVKLAAYYYFNHNTSYGPGFLGWPSKIYMDEAKWAKTINKIKEFSCPNLSVLHQSFEKTITENKGVFLYLDPPYYTKKSEDNKMLGGIYPMKNIPVHHQDFDHELLRDLLLSHDGDFVLSYNNCETIRDFYSDFDHFFPQWHYSMDIGETRIGKNREERTSEEELDKVDELTTQIDELELQPVQNKKQIALLKTQRHELELQLVQDKKQIALLKTQRHEIMKKESHEILIVKRTNNES